MIDPRHLESAVETGREHSWRLLGTDRAQHLIKEGVFAETKPRKSVVCSDCFVSHPIQKNEAGELEVVCEGGRRIVHRDEVRIWRVQLSGFADWLSGMLSGRAKAEQRIPNILWYLGDTDLGGGAFPVWFARCCDRIGQVDAIKGSLERRSPAEQGILLSSSSAAETVSWPRDTQTLRLADVLVATESGWDLSVQQMRAKAPIHRQQSGVKGALRKNDFDNVAVFRSRVVNGMADRKSLVAEARALLGIQRQMYSAEQCHKIDHIQNVIRREYGAWRDADFSELPDPT